MPFADVSSTYADLVETVFSSTIAAKAWFATAAIVLAVVQVLTASRMWGRLQRVVPLSFTIARRVHRWSGRLAVLLHAAGLLPLRDDARLPDAERAVAIHRSRARSSTACSPRSSWSSATAVATPLGAAAVAGGRSRRARDALADVEPLVLHERPLRLLMGRRPESLLVLVVSSRRPSGSRSGAPLSRPAPRGDRGATGTRARGHVFAATAPAATARTPRGTSARARREPAHRRRSRAVVGQGAAMPPGSSPGGRARRRCAYVPRSPPCRLAGVEISARIARLPLAETFLISRETTDEAEVVQVEIRHDGTRSDTARRRRSSTTTRPRSRRSRFVERTRRARGRSVRARRDPRAAARHGRAGRAVGARRGPARPAREAAGVPSELLGLERGGPADLVDDLAGRPGRDGAQGRARRAAVPASEAEDRRRATASTSTACAPCAASRRSRCRWT